MSAANERYLAAVCLAQMILEQQPAEDDHLIAEAIAAIVGEVNAGRENQKLFPVVSAELFEQLAHPKPRLHAVDGAGFSVRVPEEGA